MIFRPSGDHSANAAAAVTEVRQLVDVGAVGLDGEDLGLRPMPVEVLADPGLLAIGPFVAPNVGLGSLPCSHRREDDHEFA